MLILTGYLHAAMDSCCLGETHEHASMHDDGCGCHCLFHNPHTSEAVPPLCPCLALVATMVYPHEETPSEVLPPGIEYPPR